MAVQTYNIPEISINGVDIDNYVVVETTLHKELLKPAVLNFTIRKKVLADNESDIRLDIASSLLGREVCMELTTLRRDSEMETQSEDMMFNGIIFGVNANRNRIGQTTYIHITAYSPDYLLVDNPHCTSFEDTTLRGIIEQSVSPYNGTLDVEINTRETDIQHYVVQYNETTYQFLSRLAQRYGEFMFYDRGRMYFGRPPIGDRIDLYPDVDILGFSYDLNMEHTDFLHAQHDYLQYENITDDGYRNASMPMHHLTDAVFDASHSAFKKQTLQSIHSALQEDSTFMQLQSSTTVEGLGAKARMATCRMRTNRADICIGDRLTIKEKASGESINVDHEELLVVGVTYHATINGHFENEVVTIPAKSEYPPYLNVDLYPICESQRAQVVDNKDPEQLGRIRVRFLWQQLQDSEMISPWIRISQPHGGDDKGFYFIPEIGEEVMVAFENGNAERPYVVGTLYHGKQRPGRPWYNDDNNIKAIRTRDGHTIEIHDEDPGGYIRIYDYQKENYILTFSTDEKLIKLESTGNIELYAQNNIIMQAGNNIEMTADVNEIVQVGNDRVTTVNNDDTEHIGNNQNMRVANDQALSVGNSQSEEIGNNKRLTVTNNSQSTIGANKYTEVNENTVLAAKNIRMDAEEKMLIYSEKHDQISGKEMNIEGGNKINIHASNIKIN